MFIFTLFQKYYLQIKLTVPALYIIKACTLRPCGCQNGQFRALWRCQMRKQMLNSDSNRSTPQSMHSSAIDCHSLTNRSQSQHAASRNNDSQQLGGQSTVRHIWAHQHECTDHPKREHSVFMLWAYACRLHVFTCMWCMHAGYVLYVCVVVCIAFCLYYIMHLLLSLFLCMCVCVSGIVWPTLQMIELLSMSASACYLWMFMICCANRVNASTWWLPLSDTWIYSMHRQINLTSLFQSNNLTLKFEWAIEQISLRVCVYELEGEQFMCAIHKSPADIKSPPTVCRVPTEERQEG